MKKTACQPPRRVADAIPTGDKMTPTETKQTNAKPKN
jgi:hypothetical protein